MNRFILCGAFALVVSIPYGQTLAQVVHPQPIASGQTVEAALDPDAPRLANGMPFACYAVETAPGDKLAVVLESQSFKPIVRIARGALCSAAALQQESDPTATSSEARIEFSAAGGRYLILARAADPNASGSYALRVEGARAMPAEKTATTSTDAERQRIMQREIAQREARLAAETERRRREAEAARRAAEIERMLAAERAAQEAYYEEEYYDDYAPPQTNSMAGILNAFVGGFNSEMQKQQQMRAQFDETRRMIERQQAEARRRQAEEQRRQESEKRAASMSASMSTGGSSYSPGLIIEDADRPAPKPSPIAQPPRARTPASNSSSSSSSSSSSPSKGPVMGFLGRTCEEARFNARNGAGSVAGNVFEEVNVEMQSNGYCLVQGRRYGGHGSASRQ